MFMNEMFNHAFVQVKMPKPFGGGFAEEMYHSLLVNEYSKVIASQGGIGVAPQVKEALIRLQEVQHAE